MNKFFSFDLISFIVVLRHKIEYSNINFPIAFFILNFKPLSIRPTPHIVLCDLIPPCKDWILLPDFHFAADYRGSCLQPCMRWLRDGGWCVVRGVRVPGRVYKHAARAHPRTSRSPACGLCVSVFMWDGVHHEVLECCLLGSSARRPHVPLQTLQVQNHLFLQFKYNKKGRTKVCFVNFILVCSLLFRKTLIFNSTTTSITIHSTTSSLHTRW